MSTGRRQAPRTGATSAAGAKAAARQPLRRQARNAGTAPRKRTTRYREHGVGESTASNDKTLQPGIQATVFRPRWKGKFPLTMRVFPNFNYDNPEEFDPVRLSPADNDFSDFMRTVPAIDFAGSDRKITFIPYDPTDKSYDYFGTNPYALLFDAVHQAVDEEQAFLGQRDVLTIEWANLINREHKRFGLPKLTHLTFLQGFVYANNDTVFVEKNQPPRGAGDRDRLTLVRINASATRSLVDNLNQQVEGYQGDSDDLDARYINNRMLDFQEGKFLTIYSPKNHNIADITGESLQEAVAAEAGEAEAVGDGDGGMVGWEVALHDRFVFPVGRRRYFREADIEKYLQALYDRVQWWDKILYFPSHEEQALWIVSSFRSMPDLIRFAWQDHAELMTDEVRGVLANRTQVAGGSDIPTEDEGRGRRGQRSAAVPQAEEEPEYAGGEYLADEYEEAASAEAQDEFGEQESEEFLEEEYEEGAEYVEEGEEGEEAEEYAEGEEAEEYAEGEEAEEYTEGEEAEEYVEGAEEGGEEYTEGEEAEEYTEGEEVEDPADWEATLRNAEEKANQRAAARSGQSAPVPTKKTASRGAPPPQSAKKAAPTKKAPPPTEKAPPATKAAPPGRTATKKAPPSGKTATKKAPPPSTKTATKKAPPRK